MLHNVPRIHDVRVPFHVPYMAGRELSYMAQALGSGNLSGNGPFTKRCQDWLVAKIGCEKALLTHSCTAALEMSAILADIQPGDEVILPSFAFVTTANAFVMRGAVPVFVDVRPDTLNLDETKIEHAITEQTKAIVVLHYAGVSCEMQKIMAIAGRHELLVIEDAAQSLMSNYLDRPVGSIGHFATLSFHETKNITCGEGGALLINAPEYAQRADVIWEKGTDRAKFFRGEVDKYTWVDIGSSYLPSEVSAAFLWGQMEVAQEITDARLQRWHQYHEVLAPLEESGLLRRPAIPDACRHNGHMYYVILKEESSRSRLIKALRDELINAYFHYVPLHTSSAGRKYGRACGPLPHTENLSERLLRLPLWIGMPDDVVQRVAEIIWDTLSEGQVTQHE